jgi:hypothetical protein
MGRGREGGRGRERMLRIPRIPRILGSEERKKRILGMPRILAMAGKGE